jgi:hypothetical protein
MHEVVRLSLRDLSPVSCIPRDHLLVIFKSYFDGASEPDSITVATVCGTSEQWCAFEAAWNQVLDAHGADYLRTTDAVALQEGFSTEKGWDRSSVDRLISDCVDVIADHIEIPRENVDFQQRPGLYPITLSILLNDFVQARQTNSNLPRSVTELCATESVSFCLKRGERLGANWYHLYFDQGEPFYGHIDDRMRHPKA